MKKRLLSLFCAVSLLLTLLPTSVFAVEDSEAGEDTEQTGDTAAVETATEEMALVSLTADDLEDPYGDLSGDDLLMGYFNTVSGLDDEAASFSATKDLSSNEMTAVYEQFTTQLKAIAAGKEHNTKIELTSASWPTTGEGWGLAGDKTIWVLDASSKKYHLSEEFKDVLAKKLNAKEFVGKALADLPYDLYWFDKSIYWNGPVIPAQTVSDPNTINSLKWVIEMPVAEAYANKSVAGEERDVPGASGTTKKTFYFTTGEKPERVNTAATNAQKVVTDCTATDNYGILRHYFEYIIKEVDYDWAAVDKDNPKPYGDPWQLINVFDGVADTKVVCEGYAKAFKYLCDLTNKFTGDVDCSLVSGKMGGGPHMWNIVSIDSNNYLVDVTNCDGDPKPGEGEASAGKVVREDLFLWGNTAEADGSYEYTSGSDSLTYQYDAETKNIYGSETLTLAGAPYQRPVELTVVTAPTAAGEATYGDTLNTVKLSGGEVKAGETVVNGTWEWQDTSQSVGNVSASPKEFTAVFKPDAADGKTYATLTAQVSVTVNPKTITLKDANFEGLESSYPYEDKAVEPKFTLKDGETTIPADEYTVSYSDNNKAGTATITVSDKDGGNYTVSGTKTFTITAKAATIAITANENITYDGKVVEVGISGTDLTYTYTGDTSKTPTFTFYTDADCTDENKTTEAANGAANAGGAPKNAGTYWVKGTVEKSGNFDAAESEAVKFTIGRANYTYSGPTGVQTNVKINTPYPATISDAKAAGVEVGSVKEEVAGKLEWFTKSDCTTEATGNFQSTEGKVTLWWQFTPDASATNYVKVAKTGSKEFTVTALPVQTLTFTTPTAMTKTYGDEAFDNAATNSVSDGGTITYASSNEKVATVDANSGKVTIVGAGTTTITATAAAVEGQYAAGTAFYTLKVNKAELTITDVTLAAKTYNGKTDAEVTGVTFKSGEKAVSLIKDTDYIATGEFNDANVDKANTVTVTVTLKDTGTAKNYNLTNGSYKKMDAKIEKATWNKLNADGSAKFGTEGTVDLSSLIAEGGTAKIEGKPTDGDSVLDGDPTVADGKLKFQFKNDATLKGKKAEVVVKVTDAKNYNDYTITVTLKVTEKKVQTPLNYTGPSEVIYGKTVPLTFTGGNGTGKMTYEIIPVGGQGTVDEEKHLFTATLTGEATIKVSKAGDDTYEATAPVAVKINVTKAPLTIKVSDQKIYVGDAVPDLTKPRKGTHYTVTGLVNEGDLKGTAAMKYQQNGSEVKPDTSKPGSYVITLTGLYTATKIGGNTPHDNYNLEIVPGKLTILARPGGGSSSGGSSSSGSGKTDTTTTTKPDGTKVQTETKKDGTKIQTETKKDGSVTKTTTNPNGSSVTETKAADGSTGTVKTDKHGQTTAETALSSKAIETAKRNGEPVTAPVEVKATRDSNTAPTVKVELPKNSGDTKVEIPVSNVKPGTVAVIVHPDGTEEILKDSIPTEDGIQLTVNGGATVKIVDNSKDFADTRNHWAKDAIDFVSARGLVNGMNDSIYAPNNSTTRAQLWTILARQNDADLNGGNTWYEKAQLWSKNKGISDGANPDGTINRAQMVTMLWRAMGQPAAASGASFADVPADSYYAQAVAWAVENGITDGVGDGRFDPAATCTRAQIATFLYRYMK